MPDLTQYLTRQQVRDALGISDKTIQRLERRGLLKSHEFKRVSQQPIYVYAPQQVESLQASYRREGSYHLNREAIREEVKAKILSRRFSGRRLAKTETAPPEPPKPQETPLLSVPEKSKPSVPVVPVSDKSFLTIPEVRALTGLPLFVIESAITDNRLKVKRFNRFKRVSRSALREWLSTIDS